jgi:hypothetical protein
MTPRPPRSPAILLELLSNAAFEAAAAEIRERARKDLPEGAVMSRLAEGLSLLHGQLTHSADERRKGYLSEPRMQIAYLAHHFAMHGAKVGILTREALARWKLPEGRLRILDVGAGPLSASAGAALALGVPVDVLAVDHVGAMMKLGAPVLRKLCPDSNVTLREADVQAVPQLVKDWKPHLVVAANVVGELGEKPRRQWLWNTAAALGPDAHLLLLEPGTREHGMGLLEDRELLREGQRVHVWAPCVGEPDCPLRGTRDWCHADRTVVWPERATTLARLAGIESRQLKFSYLWVSPQAPPRDDALYRLIGGPMRAGGAMTLRYACGPRGKVTLGAHEPAAVQALTLPDRGTPWLGRTDVREVEDQGNPRPARGRHPQRSGRPGAGPPPSGGRHKRNAPLRGRPR